jgi:predicted ester cyclase
MPAANPCRLTHFYRLSDIHGWLIRTRLSFIKTGQVQRLVVGDRVVSHLRFTGHFTGSFMERKGSGQPVDFIATDIVRVRRGRITDNWHLEDNLTFLQQIGVVTQ